MPEFIIKPSAEAAMTEWGQIRAAVSVRLCVGGAVISSDFRVNACEGGWPCEVQEPIKRVD